MFDFIMQPDILSVIFVIVYVGFFLGFITKD